MSISKNFGKLARGILTATALTAATGLVPTAANAFSFGGGDDYSFIELDDINGHSYEVKIAPEGTPGFRNDAIRVMKDYVSWKDLKNLSDADSAGFLFVIRILADGTNMSEAMFRQKIGLDYTTYQGLDYKRERFDVAMARGYILRATADLDPWAANQHLEYSDKQLQKANDALAKAQQKYPNEKDYQLAPLTVQDLRNIRRNAAWLNVQFAVNLFKRIDSGVVDPKMLGRRDTDQLFQTVKLLYRDIQLDPSLAKYDSDTVFGNKYNSEIPAFMETYIKAQGMTPEAFYKRLINLNNYYDRRTVMDPVPPTVPSFGGQGTQTSVPQP